MKKKIISDKFRTGYIDESGDSGKEGSKCLVLTYISFKEGKMISRIFRKTKEALRRTKKGERWLNRNGGELKFYGFPDKGILMKTLEEIAKLNLHIQYIAIFKDGKKIDNKIKIQILYDLLGQVFNIEEMPHKIIADKDYFDNKKIAYLVIQDYEEIASDKDVLGSSYKFYVADENISKEPKDASMLIAIKHENSKNSVGLQATDLISGSIFQETENNNKEYSEILRKHIKIRGRIIRTLE